MTTPSALPRAELAPTLAPTRPLTVFHLAGDEAAMGRQHGALTRERGGFEPTLAFYASLPARILGAGRRDLGRILAVRALGPLLRAGERRLDRARPAALRARTEAYLAALGAPPEARLSLVGLDAAQNAVGLLGRLGLTHAPAPRPSLVARLAFPGACSSFAMWGPASEDGRLLHARNFDLPGIGVWERHPTLVFCRPTRGLRYGFVSTLGADVPGITAFNEAGLVLTAHTRFHQHVSFEGLGVVDLCHEIVRRARTTSEAIAIACERRVASSWGLIVSSAAERRALAIEVHARRVAVDLPAPGASWFAATNRYQSPQMQSGEVAPSAAWIRYSDGRLDVMRRRLAEARGLGPAEAMALLGSHEAGDVPGWHRATGDCLGQSISIQSVVIDPEHARIWVSIGGAPTSRGPWVEVPWRWEGAGTLEELGDARAVVAGPGLESVAPFAEGTGGEAYAAYLEAARLEGAQAAEADVEAAIGRAVELAPDDPSYRHLAGGVALRSGYFDEGLRHLEAALATERSTFRRGELHLWAARAAAWADRGASARDHLAALAALQRDEAAPSLAAARTKVPSSRHREVGVDFQLLGMTL